MSIAIVVTVISAANITLRLPICRVVPYMVSAIFTAISILFITLIARCEKIGVLWSLFNFVVIVILVVDFVVVSALMIKLRVCIITLCIWGCKHSVLREWSWWGAKESNHWLRILLQHRRTVPRGWVNDEMSKCRSNFFGKNCFVGVTLHRWHHRNCCRFSRGWLMKTVNSLRCTRYVKATCSPKCSDCVDNLYHSHISHFLIYKDVIAIWVKDVCKCAGNTVKTHDRFVNTPYISYNRITQNELRW